MPEEIEEVVPPVVDDEADEFDADFDAGFTVITGPTKTPAPIELPELVAEEPAVAAVAAVVTEPVVEPAKAEPVVEPVVAEPTDAERITALTAELTALKADSKTRFDNLAGQMGGFKQMVAQQSQTAAGTPVDITGEDFAEMRAEYPELAELYIAGLSKVLGKAKGGGGLDAKLVDEVMNTRFAERDADAVADALDSLNDVVPKWQEVVKSKDYDDWLKTQDTATQALEQSSKFRDAKTLLRKYRDRPAPPPPAPPPPPAVSTRQRQLDAGVNPKGLKGAPIEPEEDDFEAGFNARNR